MPDEMTTGEIARRLDDVMIDVRAINDDMLPREVYEAQREVYEAHRDAIDSRLTTIEQDRIATRRLIYSFIGTFLLSILVQIVVAVLHR